MMSRGHQYVLTMTCYFSKWVEAFALPDKSALSVSKALFAAYCRHGAPNDIITDQGREFVNQVSVCCIVNWQNVYRFSAWYRFRNYYTLNFM